MAKTNSKKNDKKKKYKYVTRTLTLPDGTRKYVYGKTKAEAEEKLAKLKAELCAGVDINDETTFGELAKIWVETYKAPYIRPSTVWSLRSAINASLMPAWAEVKVKDITQAQVRKLFADITNSGYQTSAIVLSCMRGIFDVAVEQGCIAKSPVPPTLKPKKREKKNEKQVVPDEVDQLLQTELTPLSPERLFYLLGRQEGMRKGEILALNWDRIDIEQGTITVDRNLVVDENGKSYVADVTKTVAGIRVLPITADVEAELMMWRQWFGVDMSPTTKGKGKRKAANGGFLFIRPCGEPHTQSSATRLWERIRDVVRKFDPDYAKVFTSHVLRHTYITRLFEAGLDVKEIQYLAGHEDLRTTLAVYTHYDKKVRQEQTFETVRGIFSGKGKTAEAEKPDNSDEPESPDACKVIDFRSRAV